MGEVHPQVCLVLGVVVQVAVVVMKVVEQVVMVEEVVLASHHW